MSGLVLKASKQTDSKQVATNCAYVDPGSFDQLYRMAGENAIISKTALRCTIKHFTVTVLADRNLPLDSVAVSQIFRQCARIAVDEELHVSPWSYNKSMEKLAAATVEVTLSPVSRNAGQLSTSDDLLEGWCRQTLQGHVLTLNQMIYVEGLDRNGGQSIKLIGTVNSIEGLDFGVNTDEGVAVKNLTGLITAETDFFFSAASPAYIDIQVNKRKSNNLFKQNFNFEELGIGGLDKEFADIFRRAFASRIYPPQVLRELGITHVKGLLLHGPPGTGKTLIARQIGKALRAKEPKVVNGPEILSKFVGQSEENIRKLFADADADQKKLGDNSPLHIIILDELDAICKQRGSSPGSTGVSDSIVNQLLSKIDGVEALNNILLIGMTNRIDMLDEALLRPGRLEVHVEVGLPDEAGRLQIFRIHTKPMRDSGRLGADVVLEDLAAVTKNFSGAEIAGLIRSAASYSFARNVDANDLSRPADMNVQVTSVDFDRALEEVKPAFGVPEQQLSRMCLNGIIPFSSSVEKLQNDLFTLARQVQSSPTSPLVSLLLWGSPGSGKTAMAVHVAQKSGFPFVKVVSPNDLLGYVEVVKAATITKIFEDAYKSDLSLVILDDIERLLDYSSVGPRYSNILLQTLLILAKKIPPKEGRRILIIGTTSEPQFIQDSGILSAFQLAYHSPLIKSPDSLSKLLNERCQVSKDMDKQTMQELVATIYQGGTSVKIAVKQIFMAIEMANEIAKPSRPNAATIIQCLKDYGVVGL
eukprot:Blabericola_migrator_1__2262@NODE_1625_length_4143_cov_95_086114_g1058_i0_p1_GENE_NODE_1625_length_4143_cov_95_086114_g1058_i0NODE_1625_length_4143_cov_95_086114_g1058_i0_p1_ORF_typecomplete_len757_score122_06AAA/PF00004_29/1_7e32AAA/PF00004_29/7e16RuvB_N/PF05496_12/7_8e05RuvB_N/PF05496_12/3_6e07AAA_22/PF13401_6/3_4e07AAA_22/PF13401_6/0_013AAA_5/PF07728_14/0_00021AAA_5/PF07728_14/2_1e05AAA_3/PF07726_11/0_0033AAA_3/PF07726_11/0_0002AAA_3/PF07726_11/1_9e02IstB_IS21/PF01695_17/2_2e05IstB_IS21/PF016